MDSVPQEKILSSHLYNLVGLRRNETVFWKYLSQLFSNHGPVLIKITKAVCAVFVTEIIFKCNWPETRTIVKIELPKGFLNFRLYWSDHND